MIGQDSFGVWLSKRRKSLGLTQNQFARQANCATITLRKIEAEQRRPSVQIAKSFARILLIPKDEQDAFLRFARGNWQSVPEIDVKNFPWQSPGLFFRSHIPAALTTMIDREQEVSEVKEFIQDENIRLVTLIGPPGVGKTRLSHEVARQILPKFNDGVYYVALATLDLPNLLALTILQSLDFDDVHTQVPTERLKYKIADKEMLLVLDNVEHLIETTGILVHELLQACPNLKILITSREVLRVAGERVYPVPPLRIPSESQIPSLDIDTALQYGAVRLFAERARAVQPSFSLNLNNMQEIIAICTRLDGLPLAIELLAAHINLFSTHTLLSRLNHQYVLHTPGGRSLSPHQKTLYQAIDWSYSLLTPDEKWIFSYLSSFAGGFTLEAIERSFSDTPYPSEIADITASLVEKSLIQRTVDKYGKVRLYLLTIVQQFAAEQLDKSGETTTAQKRHLDYFLGFCSTIIREIHGSDQASWINRLEVEQDNLRAALNLSISEGQTLAALILLTVLGWLSIMRGYYSEIFCWFDEVQALPDINDYPREYAELLVLVGRVKGILGDDDDSRTIFKQSLDIGRNLGLQGESIVKDVLSQLV